MSILAVHSNIRRIGKADGFNDETAYPDEELDLWIADANLTVPVDRLGAKADLALAYYTCHLMYRGSAEVQSSGSGGIKREKSGDVEVEYHQASSKTVSSGNSKYLDEYERLVGEGQKSRKSPMILNGRGGRV